MQMPPPADTYDAIVVGAGATGGWAAKELTERGLSVALLEAGPPLAAEEGSPSAGGDVSRQPVQARCYAYGEETAHLFVDDVDNPYTHPADKPYSWIRGRQVGGRLSLWGRMTLRMSDFEFKAASRDGIGIDWPISYADLAPYYDRVERFLQVCGTSAGLAQVPDGRFLEPPPLSPGESLYKRAVEERWSTRSVLPARVAQLSPGALVESALATGRLTLHSDSIASRVLVSADGARAEGVAFVERESGAERELRGRAVVLCASAIESARLLLNSATEQHPDGLGNSSGALGRHLMDHTYGVGVDGIAPAGANESDVASFGCVVPTFRNVTEDGVDFARGYGMELQVTPLAGGLRARLRNRGRSPGSRFWTRAFGEVLSDPENRVTIDPGRTDAWGIPVAHIECAYGENEKRMAADQIACQLEMAAAAGFEVTGVYPDLEMPGLSIHELGTARMGADPASSVLDGANRSWDVPNLLVTDASCFSSSGFQNATLTMMALTVRACEGLAERLARRQL
jgi:choline dehydrogenase-like flavoprotein